MSSAGRASRIARWTVRPPTPESKMPMRGHRRVLLQGRSRGRFGRAGGPKRHVSENRFAVPGEVREREARTSTRGWRAVVHARRCVDPEGRLSRSTAPKLMPGTYAGPHGTACPPHQRSRTVLDPVRGTPGSRPAARRYPSGAFASARMASTVSSVRDPRGEGRSAVECSTVQHTVPHRDGHLAAIERERWPQPPPSDHVGVVSREAAHHHALHRLVDAGNAAGEQVPVQVGDVHDVHARLRAGAVAGAWGPVHEKS